MAYNNSYSQCILPSGGYSWGQTELVDHITNSCGGSLTSGIVIPTGATITIQNNDVWNLSSYGAINFTVQGSGGLEFNGSDELILASGSSIIIENTSNTVALKESGVGTNIRLTIGSTTYTGNQFSAIIAAGGVNEGGLLPVELISFSGTVNHQKEVELNWETLSEQNNSHFEIEHSLDGLIFSKIGRVEGSGNSVDYRAYRFIDTSPAEGLNYYRLRQLDYDGDFRLFHVLVQEIQSADLLELYVQSHSLLSFDLKAPADIIFLNYAGSIIDSFSLKEGNHSIDLSKYASGCYVAHVRGEQRFQTFSFVR